MSRRETRLKRKAALLAVFAVVAAGCARDEEPTPPVPANAISVDDALRTQPRGTVVVYGYLNAPYDDVDHFCSTDSHPHATCEKSGLILERLEAFFYPGVVEGPGTVGLYTTKEIPLRGVVHGDRFVVDPAESLRGCTRGMRLWLGSSDSAAAVERALRRSDDVRLVRLVTRDRQSASARRYAETTTDPPPIVDDLGQRRPYFFVRPASVSAARRAARAGDVESVSCELDSE